MRLPFAALLLLCFPFSALPARGEEKRTHTISLEDYFTLGTLADVALSPDGEQVAYTVGRWQESTDDRRSDLWVVACRTGMSRQLTKDRPNARSPVWSPDGGTLYFKAGRTRDKADKPPFDGTTQVWRVPARGGEPEAVTQAEGGVRLFALSGDGKALYYVTDHVRIEGDWADLRKQFGKVEYGHGADKVSQVWSKNLATGKAESLLDAGRYIHELAPSPDGRRLAMITAPDDKVISFEGQSRVDVYDFRPGRDKVVPLPDALYRRKAPTPYGWLASLAWSSSGRSLAFNVIFDAHPSEIIVAEWSGEDPVMFRLHRPEGVHVRGYGTPLGWCDMADLCFVGEEKGRARLYRARDVRPGGKSEAEAWTPGDVVVEGFDLAPSGQKAAVILGGPTFFPDVFLAEGGKLRRLTRIDPQVDRWELPELSIVSWKGSCGDTVEGILELPPGYSTASYNGGDSFDSPPPPLPLVVIIHGGPTTCSNYHLRYWGYGRTLLPARGYAVLCPNYRGSTGYGDKFLTDLIGKENDRDVEDILQGVNALVARKIADPARLGVMGWSNGGYLTNCLITKTTRFKAASSGAGIVDTVMEWGTNDEPAYTLALKSGPPWSRAEVYQRTSPTYQLHNIRTPTLIHVGAKDERCPPGHSRMLYRALKEYKLAPTELLVYPGEAHGLMKYSSRKAKMTWDLAWFDRYILGKK